MTCGDKAFYDSTPLYTEKKDCKSFSQKLFIFNYKALISCVKRKKTLFVI